MLAGEVAALRREVAAQQLLLGVVAEGEMRQAAIPAQQQPSMLAASHARCWQLQRRLACVTSELQVRGFLLLCCVVWCCDVLCLFSSNGKALNQLRLIGCAPGNDILGHPFVLDPRDH
jgi:hypothetical protein